MTQTVLLKNSSKYSHEIGMDKFLSNTVLLMTRTVARKWTACPIVDGLEPNWTVIRLKLDSPLGLIKVLKWTVQKC